MTEIKMAPCIRGSALGPKLTNLDSWLDANVGFGKLKSLNVAASGPIHINGIKQFKEQIQSDFPSIYRAHFASNCYIASDMLITLLSDCTMLAPGVVFVDIKDQSYCISETLGDSLRCAVSFENEFQKLKKLGDSEKVSFSFREDSVDHLEELECINVVMSGVNNYGHWHVHNLSFLSWLSLHLKEIMRSAGASSVRLLWPHGLDQMGSGMKHVALSIIEKICRVEIIDPLLLKRPLRLKNALLSSTFSLDEGPLWPSAFRTLFAPFRLHCEPSAPKLIYCNRSHAGRRGIDNEGDMQTALSHLGFSIVEAGNMTYDEQRRGFSNARMIIGSHGAALTNMIYSHFHPKIIELFHPYYGPVQYGWFQNLASVMGSPYGALISPVASGFEGKGYNETYFHVDIHWLASTVQAILRCVDLDRVSEA